MSNRQNSSNEPTQRRSEMGQSDEVRGRESGMSSEKMDSDEDEFEDLDDADEQDEEAEGNL